MLDAVLLSVFLSCLLLICLNAQEFRTNQKVSVHLCYFLFGLSFLLMEIRFFVEVHDYECSVWTLAAYLLVLSFQVTPAIIITRKQLNKRFHLWKRSRRE